MLEQFYARTAGLVSKSTVWRGTRILRVIFTGGTPVPLATPSPLDRAFLRGVDLGEFVTAVEKPFHIVH